MASSVFSWLPDDIILKILFYLKTEDLYNVAQVNRRLNRLSYDRTLIRRSDFEGNYFMKEDDIRQFVQNSHRHVQYLSFSHCYWLPQRVLQWAIGKCKNLRELHVVECKLRIDTLVTLVAGCPSLQALSFSISSFTDIKKDAFSAAQETLKILKRLSIYYTSREMSLISYIGEHSTLLDHCCSLEELWIGSAGMAIPELYRPIIRQPMNHLTLKVMCITNNIHAGAQMLFYGTLSQLPNAQLHWKTLLMPNVNFEEFIRKPEFQNCLKNIQHLENLDVSGSKVHLPNDIVSATELRYLNLGMTMVGSEQLQYIANHCHKLRSINLIGCPNILYNEERQAVTCTGLESIFDQCLLLQHINLAGEHHHLHASAADSIKRMISKMKGLTSLAIPTCMLCERVTSQSRLGKRMLSTSGTRGSPYKRRCLDTTDQGTDMCCGGERGNSPQPGTSTATMTRNGPPSQNKVLQKIVENNPNLQALEIIAVNFHSAIHKNKIINVKQQTFAPCFETRLVRDAAFEPISQLRHLISLTLVGCPCLISGQSLVSIAQGCPQLQSLSLAYLGSALYGNTFSQALVYLTKLHYLRIEQPNLALNPVLFGGLAHCQKLLRLCMIAKHSTFQAQDIIRLMDQIPRLTVLQLLVGGTITACKSLTSSINKRFGKTRPALSVTIYPILHDGTNDVINTIPAKHFDEVTRFCSRVCALPPDF